MQNMAAEINRISRLWISIPSNFSGRWFGVNCILRSKSSNRFSFCFTTYLVVLQLPAHDSEGAVDEVVVDVDLGEAVRGPRRHPLLVQVVVDHHLRARGGDALLGTLVTENRKWVLLLLFFGQSCCYINTEILCGYTTKHNKFVQDSWLGFDRSCHNEWQCYPSCSRTVELPFIVARSES